MPSLASTLRHVSTRKLRVRLCCVTYVSTSNVWRCGKVAKCVKPKIFPRPREPVNNTIMSTLGNLFSAAQISALKSVATAQTNAGIYAPSLHSYQRDDLYKFAAENDVELTINFWEQIEALAHTSENVIVCVKDKRLTIEHMECNEVFARHIGMMLKRGYVMFFVGLSRVIDWDNWKGVYGWLTLGKPSTQNYDVEMSDDEYRRIKTARRKEKEFYDLARPIRAKKGGRMRISFEEARDQRVRAEKANFESKVVARANRILATL